MGQCKVDNKKLEVDFWNQAGVYILYDNYKLVYIGRATEDRMGSRLRRHRKNRHKERWDSFSWFGLRAIKKTSASLSDAGKKRVSADDIVKALEAILIEVTDPPLNRIHERISGAVRVEQIRSEGTELTDREMLEKIHEWLTN